MLYLVISSFLCICTPFKGEPHYVSIGPRAVEEISATLKSLKACISCELVRKPRSLAHVEVDSWKATELRQFPLYIGPVVLLKHTIHPHMYKSTCHINNMRFVTPKQTKCM
jgi:hypothetical protein